MQYHEVQLLATAANEEQWPDSSLPEIIFAGRSNAGKSSLINALINRRNAAYVGKTPGKTVLLNFYEVDHQVVFTDSPGYGYAKGGTMSVKNFAALLDPYFDHRKNVKGMILVLDIRRIPNSDDLEMLSFARQSNLPVLAACVKADKLSRNQQINALKNIRNATGLLPEQEIAVSSTSKTGIEEVWNTISHMI